MHDEKLITMLRKRAALGASATELIQMIQDYHGLSRTHWAMPVRYFREAFLMGIPEAKELGYWEVFLEGSLSAAEVDERFRPRILEHRAKWQP